MSSIFKPKPGFKNSRDKNGNKVKTTGKVKVRSNKGPRVAGRRKTVSKSTTKKASPDWWVKMSIAARRAYKKAHPGSKLTLKG